MKHKGFFLGAAIMLVLILAAGVFFVFNRLGSESDLPQITLLQPAEPVMISSTEKLPLVAVSRAENGIDRIEFLVNGNLAAREFPPNDNQTDLTTRIIWKPDQTGVLELEFIVYDVNGAASEPAEITVGVHTAEMPQEQKKEIEEIVANSSAGQSGGGAAESAAGPLAGPGAGEVGRQVVGAGDEGELQAGGEAVDLPPTIRLHDGSERLAGGLNISVRVIAEDDVGLDLIYFFVHGEGMEVAEQDFLCEGMQRCEHTFEYFLQGGERLIGALAMDSTQQLSRTATRTYQVLPEQGEGGVAIVIDENFNPNDLRVVEEQVEEEISTPTDGFGAPRIVGYDCSGNIVKIGVPYRYYSNNGRFVWATAWVEKDGELVAGGWAPVEYSTNGLVQMEMQLREGVEEETVTEQIRLQLRTEYDSGEPFFSKTADFSITWPVPKPDLVITDVTRSINGETADVTVQNMGCATAEKLDLITNSADPTADRYMEIEEAIPLGSASTFTIYDLDPNIFSREFLVGVDVANRVDELDEANNIYVKPPVTVKYIHFYKLDIHDTSDGEWTENSDQGEFWVSFTVLDDSWWVNRPPDLTKEWKLAKGSYMLDNYWEPVKFFNPPLEWNQDLWFRVDLDEWDTFPPHDEDVIYVSHSHDMTNVNSWKRGHGQDQYMKSEKGRFTIHWRVILED